MNMHDQPFSSFRTLMYRNLLYQIHHLSHSHPRRDLHSNIFHRAMRREWIQLASSSSLVFQVATLSPPLLAQTTLWLNQAMLKLKEKTDYIYKNRSKVVKFIDMYCKGTILLIVYLIHHGCLQQKICLDVFCSQGTHTLAVIQRTSLEWEPQAVFHLPRFAYSWYPLSEVDTRQHQESIPLLECHSLENLRWLQNIKCIYHAFMKITICECKYNRLWIWMLPFKSTSWHLS